VFTVYAFDESLLENVFYVFLKIRSFLRFLEMTSKNRKCYQSFKYIYNTTLYKIVD